MTSTTTGSSQNNTAMPTQSTPNQLMREINWLDESRRQLTICNACRYCEGYCAVFPAITRLPNFSDRDVIQLANLCHNCRGCYYACQYTEPHEFALNLPRALAKTRQYSWQQYAWPSLLAKQFQQQSRNTVILLTLTISLLFWLLSLMGSAGGSFYGWLSHSMMVALFTPALVVPLVACYLSVRRYWKDIAGEPLTIPQVSQALASIGQLKELSGGAAGGCNFEDEDRFSNARRYCHQLTMYGFAACFAATSIGTVYHYAFNWPAPYALLSLPKMLGTLGGLTLCAGTASMAFLKSKADKVPADETARQAEFSFIWLLFAVSASGLLLYVGGQTILLPILLALHLGLVLSFFLLLPFSKMVHGMYRLAALLRNAQQMAKKQ